MVAVAIYLTTLVTPGLRSGNFTKWAFQPAWIAAAHIGAALCLIATVVSPTRWRWRLAAAVWSSVYILIRAVYGEYMFPALQPWASFAQSVALSVCIAWGWGRPPIVKGEIRFGDDG